MLIKQLLSRRVVAEASKYIIRGRTSFGSILIAKREFNLSVHKAMAQTSITSFFKFTPLKSTVGKNEEATVKEETSPTTSDKKEKVFRRGKNR